MQKSIHLKAAIVLIPLFVLAGCDEIPSRPGDDEPLRVALVTATTAPAGAPGGAWTIYEIDEEGVVGVIKQSTQPLTDVSYTSALGTDGAIAFLDAAGVLVIRDIGSGNELQVGSYGPVRFSFDGTKMAYTRVVTDGDIESEQVFLLNRQTSQETQLTTNECDVVGEPAGCLFDARMPLLGADDAVYMLRRKFDETGTPLDVLFEITRLGSRSELYARAPSEISLRPRSAQAGALLTDFTRLEGGEQSGRGFIAIIVGTGVVLEIDVDLDHTSFCHDGSIAALSGGTMQILTVGGQAVKTIQLPEEYGTATGLHCSLTSRTKGD